MFEKVNREKLLDLAKQFYNGSDFEKYIEKSLRLKSPLVNQTFEKAVETLKTDFPERTYEWGSVEVHNLQRSVFRALKGLFHLS